MNSIELRVVEAGARDLQERGRSLYAIADDLGSRTSSTIANFDRTSREREQT